MATALPRPRPSRRTLVMLVAPIIVLVTVGTVANAIHPTLVKNHPLLLVALEPRLRWIILVANKVSFWPLLIWGTLRRLASDPLYFTLGHLYGDSAVQWAEKRFDANTGTIRKIERVFQKAGPVLVFLSPGALVCVLAGATGMSPIMFFALNIVGTITTVASIALTALYIWNQARRGKTEIQSLAKLDEELGGPDGEAGEVGEEKEEPAT